MAWGVEKYDSKMGIVLEHDCGNNEPEHIKWRGKWRLIFPQPHTILL